MLDLKQWQDSHPGDGTDYKFPCSSRRKNSFLVLLIYLPNKFSTQVPHRLIASQSSFCISYFWSEFTLVANKAKSLHTKGSLWLIIHK